eukprot:CAMPEP_0203641874 /NCGR_PEP_ID=MMETSP0088-20131115/7219_1 /ASSEMBLY_ACC=CAM_ASM_001087 /TAXON_ID=426623 /ORGANISM="Chaetoceros affinis, Strain CCMP159" /LENGTH=67 /DNA_ID=CAMNT_0050497493 /DNA_START=44 /DNA_END=247 /DNA_ORIENTATION=-
MIKACSNRNIANEVEKKMKELQLNKKSQMGKVKKNTKKDETTKYDNLEIELSKTFDEDEMSQGSSVF